MARTVVQRWAVALLLGGGAAFAFVGWRTIALERGRRESDAARRTHAAVARARADAERLVAAPRGRPLATWRVEEATVPSAASAAHESEASSELRAAAAEEDPQAALARYAALDRPGREPWVRHIAALRAGLLLQAAGRPDAARERLRTAAGASPFLLDLDRARVRATALMLLAEDGLRRGEPGGLRAFLDAAEDGVRIVAGSAMGPAKLLVRLEAAVRGGRVPAPAPKDGARLARAAGQAARGLALLVALPRDGVVLEAQGLGWRRGAQLALFPLESLQEEPLPGFPPAVSIEHRALGAALPEGAVRLSGALASLAVVPRPREDGSTLLVSALAFGFGLLVYAAGACLALLGWRRSRQAARQQGDFTAAVSHELKTPIASVRAMAEMMADAGADPEGARRYAGRIELEMRRLGATVANVLDAARIEGGVLPVHPRPADPAALLERAAALAEPGLAARGLSLVVDARPARASLPLDAPALEGVIANLLDNAGKFSPADATVELRGAPTPVGGYQVRVLDRGPGLGTDHPERLFLRYHRGAAARHGAVPGVGLGLHVARQIVEAHGGRIRAQNREGGGAVLEFELPGETPR